MYTFKRYGNHIQWSIAFLAYTLFMFIFSLFLYMSINIVVVISIICIALFCVEQDRILARKYAKNFTYINRKIFFIENSQYLMYFAVRVILSIILVYLSWWFVYNEIIRYLFHMLFLIIFFNYKQVYRLKPKKVYTSKELEVVDNDSRLQRLIPALKEQDVIYVTKEDLSYLDKLLENL